MRKFQAPLNTSGIGTPTGRHFACDDAGVLTLPDDVTAAELAVVTTSGFTEIPGAALAARAALAMSTSDDALKG